MAIRDIVLYPADPLTRVAEPVREVTPALAELVEDMYEAMDVFEGCGLAAPQVGLSIRLIVMRNPQTDGLMCIVNPELSEAEGSAVAEEGCLSLPHVFADVERATKVRVQGLDAGGKPLDFVATDWLARIVQHETDHLNGKVFLDRLDLLTHEDKLHEWNEVRDALRAAVERG
jgi:peptide deformylase